MCIRDRVVVDQGGAVAVHPVQCHQAVAADRLVGRLAGEQLMDVLAEFGRLREVVGRYALAGPPREDVADRALAGLVAVAAGDDAAVDHAADPGDVRQGGSVDDVAGGGAHDGEELAVLDGLGRWGGDVRVYVAGGHRDALGQAGPGGGLRCQRADPGAELGERVVEPGGGEVREVGVQGGEVVGARVLAVLEDALVPGGAGVPGLGAAELPDDPVGRLDPALDGGVGPRVLLQHLERLGVLPLGGDLPAVAGDPLLAALVGQFVDPVGLVLRRMVLPQLRPGVRPGGEVHDLGERGAVGQHGQDGAGGEVGGDADDVGRVDAGCSDGGRDGGAQHLAPVVGVLEGPVGQQRGPADRQGPVDDGVGVVVDGGGEFLTVGDPHHHGAPGERAEVDADDVPLRVVGRGSHGHVISPSSGAGVGAGPPSHPHWVVGLGGPAGPLRTYPQRCGTGSWGRAPSPSPSPPGIACVSVVARGAPGIVSVNNWPVKTWLRNPLSMGTKQGRSPTCHLRRNDGHRWREREPGLRRSPPSCCGPPSTTATSTPTGATTPTVVRGAAVFAIASIPPATPWTRRRHGPSCRPGPVPGHAGRQAVDQPCGATVPGADAVQDVRAGQVKPALGDRGRRPVVDPGGVQPQGRGQDRHSGQQRRLGPRQAADRPDRALPRLSWRSIERLCRGSWDSEGTVIDRSGDCG